MDPERRIEEIKEAWRNTPDEAILKAISHDWEEYPAEVQTIIKQEASNRGLVIEVKPISGEKMTPPEPQIVACGRAMKTIFATFGFVALCIAANIGLWCYYEWRDRPYELQIEKLKDFLLDEEAWLGQTDRKLDSHAKMLARLEQQIRECETKGDLSKYNEHVKTYNSTLEDYQALVSQYSKRIQIYDAKVEKHNKAAEKIGSRWYIIPIPIRTGGGK